MNRRSVIKCILGLAAAPKILADINFSPLLVQEEQGFIGLIPTVIKSGSVIEYEGGSFCLTDLDEIIKNYYDGR